MLYEVANFDIMEIIWFLDEETKNLYENHTRQLYKINAIYVLYSQNSCEIKVVNSYI